MERPMICPIRRRHVLRVQRGQRQFHLDDFRLAVLGEIVRAFEVRHQIGVDLLVRGDHEERLVAVDEVVLLRLAVAEQPAVDDVDDFGDRVRLLFRPDEREGAGRPEAVVDFLPVWSASI